MAYTWGLCWLEHPRAPQFRPQVNESRIVDLTSVKYAHPSVLRERTCTIALEKRCRDEQCLDCDSTQSALRCTTNPIETAFASLQWLREVADHTASPIPAFSLPRRCHTFVLIGTIPLRQERKESRRSTHSKTSFTVGIQVITAIRKQARCGSHSRFSYRRAAG